MAAADLKLDAVGSDGSIGKSRTQELSMLTAHDIYLFREGTHGRLYQGMGCHLARNAEGGGEMQGGKAVGSGMKPLRRIAPQGLIFSNGCDEKRYRGKLPPEIPDR